MKNVVIVVHKIFPQMDDDLITYLNAKSCPNTLHILHSFSDAPDRISRYKWYKNGQLYKEEQTKDYKNAPEVFIYFKEFFFTVKWVVMSGVVWDTYLGMDGLSVLFGNILKAINKVKKVIYWAIDFVPNQRFKSSLKDYIYRSINTHGYKNADEMWDLSPRMAEARKKFLNIQQSDYKLHKVVPYGMWSKKIKRVNYKYCKVNTLMFMGHLLEKQGVQLVLYALPLIIEKIPNFKFKIVGIGPYKDHLIQLAQKLKVSKYCEFVAKIAAPAELETEITKSTLSIAPYVKELDTWTYYADPGKVKTYLACGVPVLLTDIPWNAQEIVHAKCGFIISEDPKDIASKTIKLMNPLLNQEYRNNAIKYSQGFDFDHIFANLNL